MFILSEFIKWLSCVCFVNGHLMKLNINANFGVTGEAKCFKYQLDYSHESWHGGSRPPGINILKQISRKIGVLNRKSWKNIWKFPKIWWILIFFQLICSDRTIYDLLSSLFGRIFTPSLFCLVMKNNDMKTAPLIL